MCSVSLKGWWKWRTKQVADAPISKSCQEKNPAKTWKMHLTLQLFQLFVDTPWMASHQEANLKEGKWGQKTEFCQITQELNWKSETTGLIEGWNLKFLIRTVISMYRGGQERGPIARICHYLQKTSDCHGLGLRFSQWGACQNSDIYTPCSTTRKARGNGLYFHVFLNMLQPTASIFTIKHKEMRASSKLLNNTVCTSIISCSWWDASTCHFQFICSLWLVDCTCG